MTEHFIIFCTSVGKERQNNIPPTKTISKIILKLETQITIFFLRQLQEKSVTLFKH